MKANYHTHTKRCGHAQGTERDYVQAAVRAGVDVLGFSDHGPFPSLDLGPRMLYGELREHLDAVDQLAREYASDLTIYKGLEIEYFPSEHAYYEELLSPGWLDYLILGEHLYRDAQGEIKNIYNAAGTEDYLDYANALVKGMEAGYFRIVAHPDLFALPNFAWDRNCDEAADRIIRAAADTGAVLEYNANGMRRGIHSYPDGPRLMYPHPKFWEKAAASGIPVIISSDCHETKLVWDDCMPAARKALLELGITPLDYLEGLGPRSH